MFVIAGSEKPRISCGASLYASFTLPHYAGKEILLFIELELKIVLCPVPEG